MQEGETLILTYTVTVTDDSGSAGDGSTDLTITITGTNDSPVISGGDDTSALTETNTTLSDTGAMTVADIDLSDTVRASVETVEVSAAGTTFTGDVPLSNDQLKAMMSMTASTSTIEHGSISNATHAWQTINLQGNYQNPVVILGDAIGGKLTDEATARLRNVSGNSFEMRIVEPVVDGNASRSRDNVLNPGEEVTINYMVIQAGTTSLMAPKSAAAPHPSTATTTLKRFPSVETSTTQLF